MCGEPPEPAPSAVDQRPRPLRSWGGWFPRRPTACHPSPGTRRGGGCPEGASCDRQREGEKNAPAPGVPGLQTPNGLSPLTGYQAGVVPRGASCDACTGREPECAGNPCSSPLIIQPGLKHLLRLKNNRTTRGPLHLSVRDARACARAFSRKFSFQVGLFAMGSFSTTFRCHKTYA